MRDLVELVGLLDKTKLKGSGILKWIIEPDSKMEQLFLAIAEKRFRRMKTRASCSETAATTARP